MGYLRPATVEDVVEIAPHLRQADQDEIRAVAGAPPAAVLPECFRASSSAWAAVHQGRPHLILGVQDVHDHPDVGVVWMVGKPMEPVAGLEFLTRCKEHLPLVHGGRPILTNHIDARNTLHIRWLRWMGFSFLRRIERWGAESRPFLEFARLEPSCVPFSAPSSLRA